MSRPGGTSLAIALTGVAFVAIAAAAPAPVVVSEIHYHPVEEPAFDAVGNPVLDLEDNVHEFVEIQNTGATALDLGGWRIEGGVDFSFPSGTVIAPGGWRVIAKNPARLESVYSVTGVLGPYNGKLGNRGDTVRLKNPAGATADSVSYSPAFPWAMSADAFGAQDRFTGLSSAAYQYKGRSLQRVSVTANSNDPANWLASPLDGPTPGAAQAVTRTVPKPVVIAKSHAQTVDGASIIRASQPVTVNATFSSTSGLASVEVEFFVDNVNSTTETRTGVAMTALGNGVFTAALPGQPDRSIVRYRFTADRGDGVEVVSPREDDPQIAPVGVGGAREAWHGYFVQPVRTSTRPGYDLLIGSTPLATMATNINQSPRRVTTSNATGLPRATPFVAVGAPQWNGTVPAVFAHNGALFDVHIRYHGSRYHRSTSNLSFKLHFQENLPFNGQSAWFVTPHGAAFAEVHGMQRLLGLPASKMRQVDWFFNTNASITRFEQGEYGNELLDEFHDLAQQLNPGVPGEGRGELYKVVGNIDVSQNNNEGPYTKGDNAPMLANAGWTQLERYDWTYNIQSNAWKGPVPVCELIEGMWTARGDSPASPNINTAAVRAWFTANFDMDATLTSLALVQWIGIWDDGGHNQFFWRRANDRWVRLGWDFDDTMTGGRAAQTIYSNENGVNTFNGPNWWKDTCFKAWRTEFKQRLWELNNSFLDPANLTALGFPNAASFANTRQANVNAQLALGTFVKPARPLNVSPTGGAAVLGGATLDTSPYSHPASRAHASTKWEIRSATGTFDEPVLRLTSTTHLTSLPVPFDRLTYGQTYHWRATHTDADHHSSIVSVETAFTWGTASTAAGTLVLNEILADTRGAVANGPATPDFIEIRNNGATTAALGGLSLTDNPLVPVRFTIPAGTTLAAGAQMVFWCDDDAALPGLHTGFALNRDGQTVLLIDGATILDSVTFGPQAPDLSIGRIINGTGGWQANGPTPGGANSARTLGNVTNLRINEWMAAPAYGDDWFEIHNIDALPVALGELWLGDAPARATLTRVPPLSFIGGGGFARFVADDTSGDNHVAFKLSAGGDNLVLTAADGLTTLDVVTFGAQTEDVSEGRFPDGAATIASFTTTASPERPNWLPAPVVINEALSNSTPPFEDTIELHNPTGAGIDISGWWLSDDFATPRKFQIPAGTTVPAGGFVVIFESDFGTGPTPFSLSSLGDEICLAETNGSALTGRRSQVSFGPAAENVPFGRVETSGMPNGDGGVEFWPLTSPSFGAANAAVKTTPIIINEVMYHPPDGAGDADNARDEFIELHNPTASAVDIGGWRLKGDSDFTFPAGADIPARGYIVVVGFDPGDSTTLAAFRAQYALTDATKILGPFAPKLGNATQNIELAYPGPVVESQTPLILVDKVEYRDTFPWPEAADGSGASIQRLSRTRIGNDAANWLGAAPTPGAINSGVIYELTIFSESPLPGGVAGLAYSNTFEAAGGTAPYTWSVAGEALPSGLALDAAGVLAGTPATAGVFTFSIGVTDGVGATESREFTLTIAATVLAITTPSPLPNGTFDAAYFQALNATGGNAPYTWSFAGGALPAGLSIGNTGAISGRPAAPGTFNFTARVADSGGLAVTKAFSILVPAPPLSITTSSPLPNGMMDALYSQALLAVGGIAPLTWSLAVGALPAGLGLAPSGDLSGTPGAVGTFAFTARVTDAANTTATRVFSLTITPQPLAIATGPMLSGGIAGELYSQSLSATGGVAPYSWSLILGALPAGVTLSSAGVIAGMPAATGEFAFLARVTDNLGAQATKSFALPITASGPLHHFTWDYAPAATNAGAPFAVRLTARDDAGRLVPDFNGNVSLSAASTGTATTPVVITEVTHESEDQFELQNVTNFPVNTTGWFVRVGDSTTGVSAINSTTFSLPAALPAGGIVRVSEQNIAERSWFGNSIGWNTTTPRGWIMLFDASAMLRDFFAFGWDAASMTALSVSINGNTIAPVAQGDWSGAGDVVGTMGNAGSTTDSWQRTGSSDTNTAANFVWFTNGQSFGATNPGLALPWTTNTPVAMEPATIRLEGGEFIGRLAVTQAAANVRLTAAASAITGISSEFDVATVVDADADGLPDSWESANGLDVSTDDSAGDLDGDGAINAAEFFAGTGANDPASRFSITNAGVSGDGRVTVTWAAVEGKLYRITISPDLAEWSPVQPVALATSTGPMSVTVDAARAFAFFVRVELEP